MEVKKVTTRNSVSRNGFCSTCIHGREEGDYRQITLRNGQEMLSLLDATIAWVEATKEHVRALMKVQGDGGQDLGAVLDRIGDSFVQVDLQDQKGWRTLGVLRGHQTLGIVTQVKQACFVVPPLNPEKILCASTEARSQAALARTAPLGCGH